MRDTSWRELDACEDGFDEFYARAWPGAVRLATFLTHDTEVGKDIAQDVFTAIASRWTAIDEPAAYLRVAITNASRNWHRRARTATRALPLLVGGDTADPVAFELADAIARLPFRQRGVIVMRYHLDLSEAQIAAALDCRTGTVKSLASRALATLAKEIER